FLEEAVTAVESIGENVGHGDELGRTVLGQQGVLGGAGAATATANQSHLNSVILGGVDVGNGQSGQRRSDGDLAGGLDHVAASWAAIGSIGHDGSPPGGAMGGKLAERGMSTSFSDPRRK